MLEQYEQQGISPFDAPIPGESLTEDPQQPAPYERPPEYIDQEAAQEHIFETLVGPEILPQVLEQLDAGVPIDTLTQVYLYAGFTAGKWNPDLLMLLVEPVMYMLMFLAERAHIDPVLYEGEEDDLDEEEQVELAKAQRIKSPSELRKDSLAPSLLTRLEEVDVAQAQENV